MSFRHIKSILILFACFFFLGGQPIKFGGENAFFHGFMIPTPVIRVGLGTGLSDIQIRSSAGMKVYGIHTGYDLLGDDVAEVRVKGERETLSEKFVLLASQAGRRDEADLAAERVRQVVGGKVTVEQDRGNASGGVFQVKAGDYLSRAEALAALARLEKAGFPDVWVVREILPLNESRPRWVLIENELKPLSRDAVLYFIPSNARSFLSYNGRNYRGILQLRASERGVVLINVVGLEDYLRGVVPGELNPDQYAEIEALKAQAIAARTYALKNLGGYKDLGYDLTDTPSSQVYGGMSFERPLSSRAVDDTAGQVATFKGDLIDALYTSTCGGRTEDSENVFPGGPVPYLRGVECAYEKQPEWEIPSEATVATARSGGRDVAPDVAVLTALGVLPPEAAADLSAPASFDETAGWIKAALERAGRKADAFAPKPEPLSWISLARLLIGAFGWEERVRHLLLPSEVEFLLKDFPQVQGADRAQLAYGIQAGIVPFLPPTEDPARPLTRADAASCLFRTLRELGIDFREGVFRSAGPAGLEVRRDEENLSLALDPAVYLVRNLSGTESMATRLTLLGGEPLRWLERDGRVVYLQAAYPSASGALDRGSRFCHWQVRLTREELQEAINQRHPIGELVDVAVRRRGPSGRVAELVVTGRAGSTPIQGLRVRWALGLRDTLFTVDREFGPDGRPVSFVFNGKGWGHGVGLCQVGAYGMALAGARAEDILKKYYRGVKIEKSY